MNASLHVFLASLFRGCGAPFSQGSAALVAGWSCVSAIELNRSAVRWAAPGFQLSAEHSCANSGTCFFTVFLHTLTLLGPTRKKRSLLA